MRQALGPKKVRRLREKTGLAIKYALVRGGTGHRTDLHLEDGRVAYLWPDGTVEDAIILNALRGGRPEPANKWRGMTDDEILAVANEVLRPAGIMNARIRHPPMQPDGGTFVAFTFDLPIETPTGEPTHFHSGWTIYPETPALTRDRVLAGAHDAVQFAVSTTATWPTPWVPANRSEGLTR